VLPLSPQLVFQAVHADDVAAAVWLILEHRAAGPFNIATAPILGPDDLARALGARRAVPLPLGLLRGLVAATWHARLQPTEPGWIDLAGHCPVMSTARIRELGWVPTITSQQALQELVQGMRSSAGSASPPMRSRGALTNRAE
jgi:nucleoside-diphosphate-sugar epimerase